MGFPWPWSKKPVSVSAPPEPLQAAEDFVQTQVVAIAKDGASVTLLMQAHYKGEIVESVETFAAGDGPRVTIKPPAPLAVGTHECPWSRAQRHFVKRLFNSFN